VKERGGFLFAASAAIAVALFTSGPAAATAAPAAVPAGYTASFTGTLKGAAQGGTSDGCVITARPVDPNQAAVSPSPAFLPRLITVKWDNFTVKHKPASMQLLVGAPLAATGGPGAYPVPWQSGAPTGSAELTVTTPNATFVTTPDVKPAKADTTGVFSVDSTLKQGKQKLHVKASFDCSKAGTSGDVPTR
jgi:hypothetical protein